MQLTHRHAETDGGITIESVDEITIPDTLSDDEIEHILGEQFGYFESIVEWVVTNRHNLPVTRNDHGWMRLEETPPALPCPICEDEDCDGVHTVYYHCPECGDPQYGDDGYLKDGQVVCQGCA